MRDTLRCCISCILPCGALDVIRIVHVNGRVEEITGTIYAAEILKAHPKHILKKPTTKPISDDIEPNPARHRPAIVVVPPDAQLQRGKIYFLIPDSTSKKHHKPSSVTATTTTKSSSTAVPPDHRHNHHGGSARRKRKEHQQKTHSNESSSVGLLNNSSNNNKDDDKYLSEILSEKVSSQRERRRGRVAVWRPHLESITETLSDAASSEQ